MYLIDVIVNMNKPRVSEACDLDPWSLAHEVDKAYILVIFGTSFNNENEPCYNNIH